MTERPSFSVLRDVRVLFPKGKHGIELLRELLTTANRTPNELLELRKQFGEGKTGRAAFITIAFRAGCESIMGTDGKGELVTCGKEGKMTLDIDVGSEKPDTLPMCSSDHLKLTERSYFESLERQGKHGWPSKNGFGRA